ncbi:hypothetical protein D6745_03560 [Candidatus Woesearchaeota archaeon]|nr:MAG: hypothetical protein D6745_03560 [Candidatus Woesearchaeota archaeon]
MVAIRKLVRKIDAVAAWLLFFVLLAYFVSGFVMLGYFGFVPLKQSKSFHISVPISVFSFILLLIHPGIQIYYRVGKWKKALRKYLTRG